MTQKRGEMGHKKEMPHRVGHDNVIARVRGVMRATWQQRGRYAEYAPST